jgi:hypothetical protein
MGEPLRAAQTLNPHARDIGGSIGHVRRLPIVADLMRATSVSGTPPGRAPS